LLEDAISMGSKELSMKAPFFPRATGQKAESNQDVKCPFLRICRRGAEG